MSLHSLIENQKIIIDDHKKGAGEIKDWDNLTDDIHIDKKTLYKIEGKREEIRIRLPINSDREIRIEKKSGKLDDIPRKLRKEIKKAFEDKNIRQNFIQDLISVLKNYSSNFDTFQQVKDSIKRVIKHFDLNLTDNIIVKDIADMIKEVEVICDDENHKRYYVSMNKQRILISDIDKNLEKKLLKKGLLR